MNRVKSDPEKIYYECGARLNEVCNYFLNGRKKDFAEAISGNFSSVTQILNGKREPTFQLLKNVKKQFNVNLNWIVTGEGSMLDHTNLNESHMEEKLKYKDMLIKEKDHRLQEKQDMIDCLNNQLNYYDIKDNQVNKRQKK